MGVVVSPDGTRAYVSSSDFGPLSVIDTATNTVVNEISLGGYRGGRLAVSPDGTRLYVVGAQILVVDTASNTVISDSAFGVYAPSDVAVSPDGSRVYVSDRIWNGTVSVIDTATNTVVGEPIPVGHYPSAIALSPDGSRLYVTDDATEGAGTVSVIDTTTNTVVGTVTVGDDPLAVAVSPDGRRIYVANTGSKTVTVIDATTNTVVGQPISVGNYSSAMVVSPDGKRLYVTDSADNTVSVIDTASKKVIGTVAVGDIPLGVAISPDGSRLYVTNVADNTVSVVSTDGIGDGGATGADPFTDFALAAQHALNALKLSVQTFFDNLVNFATPKPSGVERAAPSSTAQLYSRLRQVTNGDSDGIYIEKVRTDDPDHAVKYIVYLGGTASFSGGNQSLIKNLPSYRGTVDQHQVDMINAALEADGNQDAEIMLVGYSQGGMDAQNIAASGLFNVSTVVTYGSPIIRNGPTSGYQVVHLQADLDPIPGLSKSGVTALVFNRRPSNVNFFSLFFDPTGLALHGDPATYVSIGNMFDANAAPGYAAVKANIRSFQGDVIRHY